MQDNFVDIQDLFIRASRDLTESLERAGKQYAKHSASIGEAAEKAFRTFLEQGLPRAFAVGKGFVFEAGGKRGLQQDVIFYDNLHHPSLVIDGEQGLFPIDTVVAAIEVKATLNGKEIIDAVNKIAGIKSLKRTITNELPGTLSKSNVIPLWSYIFAYGTRFKDSWTVAEHFAEAVGKHPPEQRPDNMFILGKWWFDWVDKERKNAKHLDTPAALRIVHVGQYDILQLWTRLMGQLTWYRMPKPLDWISIPDWGAREFKADYLEFGNKA